MAELGKLGKLPWILGLAFGVIGIPIEYIYLSTNIFQTVGWIFLIIGVFGGFLLGRIIGMFLGAFIGLFIGVTLPISGLFVFGYWLGSYYFKSFRTQIIHSLGVEPFIDALKDENSSVIKIAAETLGEIGDDRGVEPLIQLLKDEDEGIRANAAKALGQIGDNRAIESLSQAQKDKAWSVQTSAREALEKIMKKTNE